jgi:hypothetical protein
MTIKLGTIVRQKVRPIVGRVMRTQYNEADECLQHLVESEDGTQSVWINADQVEADPAAVGSATEGAAA